MRYIAPVNLELLIKQLEALETNNEALAPGGKLLLGLENMVSIIVQALEEGYSGVMIEDHRRYDLDLIPDNERQPYCPQNTSDGKYFGVRR